jgi:putative nucleotidyltransferase with HDIG domain
MLLSEWAAGWAEGLLGTLGERWDHTLAVVTRAHEMSDQLGLPDSDVLVAAAYVHDVGYAPQAAVSGFHPLDGARQLRDAGRDRLAGLVANHGGAAEEARLRGLHDELDAFAAEDTFVARVLDYCDLTVGPAGETMTPNERLAEVEARYGPEHVVARGLRLAWPRLEERVAEVADRLVLARNPQPT